MSIFASTVTLSLFLLHPTARIDGEDYGDEGDGVSLFAPEDRDYGDYVSDLLEALTAARGVAEKGRRRRWRKPQDGRRRRRHRHRQRRTTTGAGGFENSPRLITFLHSGIPAQGASDSQMAGEVFPGS